MTKDSNGYRAQNLDFLRWRHGTHKHLHKKLAPILNWAELSHYSLGSKPLSDYRARQIEKTLELPAKWLDRNNMGLTSLASEDFALIQKLLAADPKLRVAIGTVLDAIL